MEEDNTHYYCDEWNLKKPISTLNIDEGDKIRKITYYIGYETVEIIIKETKDDIKHTK